MEYTKFDVSGVLRLKRITPVIRAFFGQVVVGDVSANGDLIIAKKADADNPTWEPVFSAVVALANEKGIVLRKHADGLMTDYLCGLALHFGLHEEKFANMLDHIYFEDEFDIEGAFEIAVLFNDGHDLTSMEMEGCSGGSGEVVKRSSGYGSYMSKNINVSTASTDAIDLGRRLDLALGGANIDLAATWLTKEIDRLMQGIHDEIIRDLIWERIISNETRNK